jgi:hypothetical protein
MELDKALLLLALCRAEPAAEPGAPLAAAPVVPEPQPPAPREEPVEAAAPAAPTTRQVRLRSLGIDMPPCRAGDPLCSDIVTADRGTLDRAVRGSLPAFRRCYDKSAVAQKRGSMAITLRLGAWGNQTRPATTSVSQDTLGDPGLADCVQRAAGSMRFPAETDGATVHVGLRFSPK